MTKNITMEIICGLVFVTIAFVNAAPSVKLPKGFIQCSKSDPKFEECLTNAFQKGIPHLAKGIPSLNIHKLDPFRITALKIDQGSGPVSIKLNFNDLDVYNISHAQIKRMHYDPVNYNADIDVQLSSPLSLDGDYDINGKVLILPIVGKGKSEIDLYLSSILINVQFKPMVKNGKTYLEISKLDFKCEPSNLVMKFTNLFNGDKALGDNMNVFLNENWREVLKELLPAVEQVIGVIVKDAAQNFFKHVPENQIFLP